MFLLLGLVFAVLILASIPKLPNGGLRGAAAVSAALVFFVFFGLSSFRYVPADRVGVVVKNVGGKSLAPGKIIAAGGEKGPQAKILPPGWHPWLWPVFYDVQYEEVVVIPEGSVGLLTASDGEPLHPGEAFASEWTQDEFKSMLDASYFLTDGGGFKGPQTSVLRPGSYRINTRLFKVDITEATNIEKATVGVVKSNVGPDSDEDRGAIVGKGSRGIWDEPLYPAKYYLNTKVYEVTVISTKKTIVRYTALEGRQTDQQSEENEIRVRTSDGFTFPVDVRVEFEIKPEDAPLVVATVGNDIDGLRSVLNSAVRAIFRNNAESVKALDYVKLRSLQESQSLAMLAAEMSNVGVTVTAVRIGDVGDEETLGPLLKTQTDREIAVQEQITFQEQQRAAEQMKELTKTEQEAEEEKRLATAHYDVQIAEQDKLKLIIDAEADSEAIEIRAAAQAEAFRVIAEQIGAGNAALLEVLDIIGRDGIQITPRVMVNGQSNGAAGQTTALIGTMLDTMIQRDEQPSAAASNDQ